MENVSKPVRCWLLYFSSQLMDFVCFSSGKERWQLLLPNWLDSCSAWEVYKWGIHQWVTIWNMINELLGRHLNSSFLSNILGTDTNDSIIETTFCYLDMELKIQLEQKERKKKGGLVITLKPDWNSENTISVLKGEVEAKTILEHYLQAKVAPHLETI